MEYLAVEKLLPTLFFNRLKYANDLDASEQTVVRHIKNIIANFTIVEATRRNRIKIVGAELVQMGNSRDNAAKTADAHDLERTATFTNLAGDHHVSKLLDYLNRHRAAFPLCYHTDAGGENSQTDAFGYVPPPATPEEIKNLRQLIEAAKSRRVVGL